MEITSTNTTSSTANQGVLTPENTGISTLNQTIPLSLSSISNLPSPAPGSQMETAIVNLITELVQTIIKKFEQLLSTALPNPAPTPIPTTPSDTTNTSAFKAKAGSILSPNAEGKVSEVEVQYAIVSFQLFQADPKLEELFKAETQKAKEGGETTEKAIVSGLRETYRKSGKFNKPDAEWVLSLSYRAAQSDADHKSLSTGPTLPLASALQVAEATLAGIQAGAIPVTPLKIPLP